MPTFAVTSVVCACQVTTDSLSPSAAKNLLIVFRASKAGSIGVKMPLLLLRQVVAAVEALVEILVTVLPRRMYTRQP